MSSVPPHHLYHLYSVVPLPRYASLNPADPYHGQEDLATIAARFITHLFGCPDYISTNDIRLPIFIAHALHRTKRHPAVIFAALVLLQRLKARFPSARRSSGHRLFITAYMISSKVMNDDIYSNQSWSIVAQGMFTLREINQMEREMCTYLDWNLTVHDPILSTFEKMVRHDFKEPKPSYPNYPNDLNDLVSRRAIPAADFRSNTPFNEKTNTTSTTPSFASKSSPTPSTKPSVNFGTSMKVPQDSTTPDTPSPSFSKSTSSSGSPVEHANATEAAQSKVDKSGRFASMSQASQVNTKPNRWPDGGGPRRDEARMREQPAFATGSQLPHTSDNQLATGSGQNATFFSGKTVSISGGVFQFNVNPDPSLSHSVANSRESTLRVSTKVLGIGSCGTVVYQGSFQGRPVAVKRLLRDFVTLAEREVSILQESDHHPNVVRYYYQEAREDWLFIAIELCLASLADIIEKPNRDQWRDITVDFDPKRALEEITSGLDHLHNLNVVHRDLKPQNVLISAQKTKWKGRAGHRMLISDFGLCKRLDDDQLTSGTSAAGTRGWQAPEILRIKLEKSFTHLTARDIVGDVMPSSSKNTPLAQRKLTKSMDIFPLGCLFYYTLTKGRHPYGDEFVREMNILKGAKDLFGVEKLGEEGLKAKDLIAKMLNPEPKQRPDTTTCLEHPYFTE